ncbi:odorant receptor 13a-like [Vespula squamosa]|uniref:Odorant receptor 13a-like n=1 Tax=Vespula squamosa TaxID=30214 RepID=A0ABD2A848_VESSQ
MRLFQIRGRTVQPCIEYFQEVLIKYDKNYRFVLGIYISLNFGADRQQVLVQKESSKSCISAITDLMAGEGEQMPLVEMFFFAFYIVYVLLQLYLYCYVGEQLWSESTEVARAAYECKWYELLPNDARSLILIIRRSRSPLRLTAGKFCIFNHELYSSVSNPSGHYKMNDIFPYPNKQQIVANKNVIPER